MQTKGTHHELGEHELLDMILERTKAFLRKNGLHILVGVAILALIGVSIHTFLARRTAAESEAWQSLDAQGSISYLYRLAWTDSQREQMISISRQIVDEHPRSSAAPWAMLRLASLHALGSDWEAQQAACNRVIEEHPDPLYAEPAMQGLAAALEDMGMFAEAAKTYEEMAERPNNLRWWMDAGRCYEMAGDAEAARQAYGRLTGPGQEDATGLAAALARMAAERLNDVAEGRMLTQPPQLKRPQVPEPAPPAPEEEREEGEEKAAPADTPVADTPVSPSD